MSDSLVRTDSAMSFSSEDDRAAAPVQGRRTRKRFTNIQLTLLEHLFHQNSHPSREDREAVAKAGGMEIKSVTIWFQNKRQTERKSLAAANNNTQTNTLPTPFPTSAPHLTSAMHTFSLHSSSSTSSRNASPPFTSTTLKRSSSRPSLDRVASRSELRSPTSQNHHQHASQRTPRRSFNSNTATGAIWDSMPSSPLAPPVSPPQRELIDFGRRRTLEWACAAARLADKDGVHVHHQYNHQPPVPLTTKPQNRSREREVEKKRSRPSHYNPHLPQIQPNPNRARKPNPASNSMDVDNSTDHSDDEDEAHTNTQPNSDDDEADEDHEAITPPSTWGKGDVRWEGDKSKPPPRGLGHVAVMGPPSSSQSLPGGADDDDMFKAALALCGLGRRPT